MKKILVTSIMLISLVAFSQIVEHNVEKAENVYQVADRVAA
ncbi:hypothetical protein [Bacillus safensis]|nr:hypothetical protein [Bacillus safensis]